MLIIHYRILNSRLFKFTVGETVDGSPTEFLVHEEAMAQLSKPLYNLMKGLWSDSQAGSAAWDDVSKETFERFAQFAYTGDYSVPMTEKSNRNPKKQKAVTNGSSLSTSNGIVSWEGPDAYLSYEDESFEVNRIDVPAKKHKKKKGRIAVPEGTFESLSFPLLALRNNHSDTCEPAEHFDQDHSYSNVFLSHASLYVLGDFQLIDSLKALALFKLHKTLCVFELNEENAEDVIDLARYAYSEEGGGGAGSDEGVGGLRSLVCQYLAENALAMSCDDGFMDLLAEGGQLVKDFFRVELQMTS